MTDAEILDKFTTILSDVAGVNADDVELGKSLIEDLEIDSLAMVEIAMEVEKSLGIGIPDEQLSNLKTVADVVDYIKANS
ncbi:MAG: acyl carrier protein [Actinomycetota bacterium]|jgi:acyl carrier protein